MNTQNTIKVIGNNPNYPHFFHIVFNDVGYKYNAKSDKVFRITFNNKTGSGLAEVKTQKTRKAVINAVKEYLENDK